MPGIGPGAPAPGRPGSGGGKTLLILLLELRAAYFTPLRKRHIPASQIVD